METRIHGDTVSLSIYTVALLASLVSPSTAKADGGAIRLSEQRGAYQITVFTSPTPLRAGLIDVSVLVQNHANGQVVPDVHVSVQATRLDRNMETISAQATTEAATNKLLKASLMELSESGQWRIEVQVEGSMGPAQVQFKVEVAEPAPRWQSLCPWITWPGLAIALFGVHQFLVRRRDR